MSRETERLFVELEKRIKAQHLTDQKEIDDLMSELIKEENEKNGNGLNDKNPDPWDYLQKAENAKTKKDALKYAKKALEIDPDFIDAEALINELSCKNIEDLKKRYEQLLTKEKKHLEDSGITFRENMGDFWGLVETRPYMRIKNNYMHLLLKMGKYRKAIEECREMLELCESDNLGVRYCLIALYAFLEDEDNAVKIYVKFERENSAFMLLALSALYYKVDDYPKAEEYLEKLEKINPETKKAFMQIQTNNQSYLQEAGSADFYRPESSEEIILAIVDAAFLYQSTEGFLEWAGETVKSGKKTDSMMTKNRRD
jgi:tetratricopeptide (TPR) repeat protein